VVVLVVGAAPTAESVASAAAAAADAFSFLRGFYLHRDADGWLDLLFEPCE
jgi:hypothetical protein